MISRFLKNCLKSLFYRPLVKNIKNIGELPVIDKSIFMSNFDQINTVNISLANAIDFAAKAEESRDFSPKISNITVGLSSGTSGNRGVFLASDKERAYWVALILDRVTGISFKTRSVAFFLRADSNIYNSVNSKLLRFYYFDLLDPIEDHLKALNTLQPAIIVGQPSLLIELAKAIEGNKLDIHPKKIISVAEVLTPEDKIYLTKVFAQIIHQVYQCTEGFLASTCKNGTLHFNEDYLFIEKKYIDQENIRFHPIITDLKRKSQPIIRYELNDIIIAKESCSCGSKMLAIESIVGRSDDVLVFTNGRNEEVKIYPDFLRKAIIMSSSEIKDYALIQNETKHLLLYIQSQNNDGYDKANEAVQNLLNKNGIFNVAITRYSDHKIVKGDKLRRIRNDTRKIN